jgi:UDP-2-acetamido-3-amino-2,3-dideoxy-glucuronate N-acetyltransferase
MTNLAMIGCGYWGRNLVRNFSALGALGAICDDDPAVAASLATPEAPARSLDDILGDPAITAVAIATPAATHAALVRRCLLAGKDVFVEKPMALKVGEAKPLIELAARSGRVLMVGHLLQYHPAFLRLKELCRAGTIGRIRYVYSNRLNLGKFRSEENTLWSFAPHDISMILSLIEGPLESVSAVGHSYLHKGIADVTTTHLTFASGQAAHVHVSWLHPFKEQRLVVIGEAGMVVFDDREGWDRKLLLYPHRIDWIDGRPQPHSADAQPVPVDADEPLKLECRHFLDCVASRARPRTDGTEGIQVLRVLEAAQNSLNTGRTITMDAVEPTARAFFAHETAEIDEPVEIGEGTRIWHFSHVLKNSRIGADCNIGQNVVIGPDVAIGDRCKIQNNVSVYPGVELEDGVFCGPSMVFTNVFNPRAEIERKHEYRRTLVRRGATIGANATIVCGTTIGRYAFVGAGAVVIRDVPDYAMVVGNPARRIGWACACGVKLPAGTWIDTKCPACGTEYGRNAEGTPIKLGEDQ